MCNFSHFLSAAESRFFCRIADWCYCDWNEVFREIKNFLYLVALSIIKERAMEQSTVERC